MKAEKLYKSLDKEFELDKLQEDEWSFLDLGEYMTKNFKNRRMGLVLDNTDDIKKVYTAVFPSERVLDHILAFEEKNVLLFTHHPMMWHPSEGGFPFRNIPTDYLEQLKEREISYYSIHVPLDRNGPYGTTASLARALEIETEKEFFEYFGVHVGIIGKTKWASLFDLVKQVKETVGHLLKVWVNGSSEIPDQRVALVAGGGNDPDLAQELAEEGIKTYITGVTYKNPDWEPGLKFHEICKDNKINVIAATHYSTEKFACIAVQEFFERLGIPSKFVEDEPNFDDYG
ncbi:MAG: Nif3-like dinuclear metal center hexameric protein [Candidatus Thorarchaeota archaeon]|jgi:putative NIF3 family GTP cyclohydrolase 1 type 2